MRGTTSPGSYWKSGFEAVRARFSDLNALRMGRFRQNGVLRSSRWSASKADGSPIRPRALAAVSRICHAGSSSNAIRASTARGLPIRPRLSAAHCRTTGSRSRWRRVRSAGTATSLPNHPSERMELIRTSMSSSVVASMSGWTLRRSPRWPSARAATHLALAPALGLRRRSYSLKPSTSRLR